MGRYGGEPETPKKMDKKKAWEGVIQPGLATDGKGVCVFRLEGAPPAPFRLAGGECTASVTDGIIS